MKPKLSFSIICGVLGLLINSMVFVGLIGYFLLGMGPTPNLITWLNVTIFPIINIWLVTSSLSNQDPDREVDFLGENDSEQDAFNPFV